MNAFGWLRFRFWFRLISCGLIIGFLSYDIVWANPSSFLPSLGKPANSFSNELPGSSKAAEISYYGRKNSAPVVYHIQDAHAVYEAQENLSKLLEFLIQKEGIDLVLVEGGVGNVNLTPLRNIAWKKVRRRVAADFLRQGKITGEEFLQLSTNYSFDLYGVEDPVLYRKNLSVFLDSLDHKGELSKALGQLESVSHSLEITIYPLKYREMASQSRKWRSNTGDFLGYLRLLEKAAGDLKIAAPILGDLERFKKSGDVRSFNGRKVLSGIADLEIRVRGSMLDKQAHRLWGIEETLGLLNHLFSFELTSEEYNYFLEDSSRFNQEQIKSALVSLGVNPLRFQKALDLIENERPCFLKFYELTRQRDKAFIGNIKRILRERNAQKIVLITGGFHSENLGRLFKQNGISQVLLSPEITSIPKGADLQYSKILRAKSKSTLRAPATFGTPVYLELETVLRYEQSKELAGHINRLISLLDIDQFLQPKEMKVQYARSELRVELFSHILSMFSLSNGTAIQWILAGIAGILGAIPAFFLFKRWKSKSNKRETPLRDIPNLARVFGAESERFFATKVPVIPQGETLSPPPFELPLPAAVNAIPANLDAKGKTVFVLNEVLRAMNSMDDTVRSHQISAAEQALRRLLAEGGTVDQVRFRQYLEEDIHAFFQTIFMEMQKFSKTLPVSQTYPVSEEVEQQFGRFPRFVKFLLTEHPGLSEDPEVKGLMSRISARLGSKPPVAEGLETHLEHVFFQVMEERHQQLQPVPIPVTSKPDALKLAVQEPVAIKPAVPKPAAPKPEAPKPSPKKTVDTQKIRGQLENVQRMRTRFETEFNHLEVELLKVDAEYKELQESMEEARKNNDMIIQKALGPSIDAYETRLQTLRFNREELQGRFQKTKEEETRLSGLLDEERGTARSELRTFESIVFNSVASFATSHIWIAAMGFAACSAFYLVNLYRARKSTQSFLKRTHKDWLLDKDKIFKETVPLKPGEKLALSDDNRAAFTGLGVITGWVVGGRMLYLSYYAWDIASKALYTFSSVGEDGKHDTISWGVLLWVLEIFVAPFVGALLGFWISHWYEAFINSCHSLSRVLRFPLEYERALRLHLLPFKSLKPRVFKKNGWFFSRMETTTLAVAFRDWINRGEHEKIKMFLEKGDWRSKRQLVIELYKDISGFESAKKALLDLAGENNRAAMSRSIARWKANLDAQRINEMHLLKDLIPELIKKTNTAASVSAWMDRLFGDPFTPWHSVFSVVKQYVDALERLDALKAEAQGKFILDKKELDQVNDQIKNWRERMTRTGNKEPENTVLAEAIISKAINAAASKGWFLHILVKVLDIDASLFSKSRQTYLLLRFEKIIAYESVLSTLLSCQVEGERFSLKNEVLGFEAFAKGNGLDLVEGFTDAFKNIEKEPASTKIAILRAFRGLNPSVYQKDLQAASRAFGLLADKEILKARLLANGGSSSSLEALETKTILGSMEAIEQLKGFYSVLLEKGDVKAQGALLDICARAPPEVLSIFLKSRETLVSYYLAHPSNRDYDNLPVLVHEYLRRYGELYFLYHALLDLLTDPLKPAQSRLEEARKTIAGQILFRAGFPGNVIGTWDAVSFEEIIQASGYEVLRVAEEDKEEEDRRTVFSQGETFREGEKFLPTRIKIPVVTKALEHMGRWGLFSYWEDKKPAYYLQFLEETKGLDPGFFKPGEKFRVPYEEVSAPARKTGSLIPVEDPVQTMKGLIRSLRDSHPNIYENFISPQRENLGGRPLEDFIDGKSLVKVAEQFRKKVADWPLSEEERTEMTILAYQVAFSNALQAVLGTATTEEEMRYWQDTLQTFQKVCGIKRETVLYRKVTAQIKKRIDELGEEIGAGREGVVQFILTRGSVSDFLRGEISEDCCSASRNIHFADTLGLPTDPAFLSFRMVENGKWIGNIYAIVLKDKKGKYAFYLDSMSVMQKHPVTTTQIKTDKLVRNFYPKLKHVLENAGFDYLGIADDPSSRTNIRSALRALGGTKDTKTMIKPGGFGHQTEFSVSSEYLQGLGTLSSSVSAKGFWIPFDNRAMQEEKRKTELSELERQIRAIVERQENLKAQRAEKAKRVQHLEASVESAGKGTKRVTAQVLQEAVLKETLEFRKISDETKTLEEELQAMQSRFEGLKIGTARSELRLDALSQIFEPESFLILFFGGLFLLAAVLLVWAAWEDQHDGGVQRESEYRRSLERHSDDIRYDHRAFESFPDRKNPFLLETESLFKTVLKQVSPQISKLVPPHIFFPIMGFGMGLTKQLMSLLGVARFILTILKEKGSLIPFLREQDYYKRFKEETVALGIAPDFDVPKTMSSFTLQKRNGSDIRFSLEISDRVADDLLRGDISRDCTGLGACAAFYETIPQFLLDPGFLNLKLRMQGRWVGNIYVIVMKSAGKPTLVIDAVQLHPSFFSWPIKPEKIAQKAVDEIAGWAKTQGFKSVFMSRFVSNFYYLYEYFDTRYRPNPLEIEKVGGFEHLKSFGFWDEERLRNQYIETFSPHWNEPLKNVHPNRPEQTLLLRPVWVGGSPVPSGDTGALLEPSSSTNAARSELRDAPVLFGGSHFQKLLLSSFLLMSFFGTGCAIHRSAGIRATVPPPVYAQGSERAHQTTSHKPNRTIPKKDDAAQITKDQAAVGTQTDTKQEEKGSAAALISQQPDQESPVSVKGEQVTTREIKGPGLGTPVIGDSSQTLPGSQERNVPVPAPSDKTQAVSPEKTGAAPVPSDASQGTKDTREVQGSSQDQHAKQLEEERAGHLAEIGRLTQENSDLAQNLAGAERQKEELSDLLSAQEEHLAQIDQELQKLEAGINRLNRTLNGISGKLTQLEKEAEERAAREREMEKRLETLEAQSAQQSQMLAKHTANDKTADSNSGKSQDRSSYGKWFLGAFAAIGIVFIIAMTVLLKRFAKLIREAKDASRHLPGKTQTSTGEEPVMPSAEVLEARRELDEISSQTRESRKQLQDTLEELESARTDLARMSEAAQAKTRELAEKTSEEIALRNRIEALKHENEELETRRQALLAEAERLEAKNRELAAVKAEEPESGDLEKIEALQTQNAESLQEIERLRQKIEELTQREAQREEGLRTLEDVTAKVRATVEESERKGEELAQTERKLEEISGTLETREHELAGKLGALTEVGEAVTAKSGELKALQERIETLQAEVGELESRKDALSKSVDELASTQSQLLEAQTQLADVNRQYAAAKAEYDRILGLKDAATSDLRGLQEQLLQAESAAEAIGARIADLKDQAQEKEALLARITEVTSELESKTRALRAAQSELSGIETQKDADTGRASVLQAEISQKGEELAALKEETVRLSAELETLKSNMASLSEAVAAKQTELKELEENKTRLLAETGALEGLLSKTADELARTQSQLLEAQTQLSEINRQYAFAKTEYDRILGLKEAATGDFRELREQLLQAEKSLEAITKKITELTGELEAKTRALETARTELSLIERQKGADTDRAAALQSELSQKGRELAALKEEAARLSAELETLRGNIASLSEAVVAKQKELTALEENKTRLITETGTLEDQARELEGSKKKLGEEQAARQRAEEAFAVEQRKVNETAGHLRTVGERLAKTVSQLAEHETRTGALDSELAAEKERRLKAEEAAAQVQAERDRLEADLTHTREEKNVLEEALREAGKAAKGEAADAVLDGRESLETLLSGLPSDLWQLLGRRFPGPNHSGFQMTVSSVVKELVQAWNVSPFFRRVVKNLVLYRSQNAWFQKQPFYQKFKRECDKLGLSPDFDKPGEHVRFNLEGDPSGYSLELSQRDAEYLLRGFISGDCTNCGPGYVTGSFLTATGSHITDPGFLNFKIFRNGEWVGNVYVMAIRDKNKPVLVIDAIQIPWQEIGEHVYIPFDRLERVFPVKTEKEAVALAEGVISALSRYSAENGFRELWLSSFVSNFSALKQYFYYSRQQEFDKRVNEKAKIGGWSALEALGYEGHPYVESIGNPKAEKVWDSVSTPAASGYQLEPEQKMLVEEAIDNARKTVIRNIKADVQNIFFELMGSQGIEPESLDSFIENSDFKLVVVHPPMAPNERAPPMGLGVNLGKPGRDVFASFQVQPKERKKGFEVTIYVGAGIYELAGERERLEIIAHELYEAFRLVNSENARKYPVDVDLEQKIDQEIENAEAWESRIPQEEREDLGLIGGMERQEDVHVRARAFARLVGAKSTDGIGTTYTSLLRNSWALASRFSGKDVFGSIPALPDEAFRYTQGSLENGVSTETYQGLFETFAYVHEHKEEDIAQFLVRKNEEGKRVLLLNTNAPTPWILKDIRKMIKGLSSEEKLAALYLDLPPKSQRLVDEFLRTGKSSAELLKVIAARFPVFLPQEFQRPELYENILRAVYESNLEAPEGKKIRVICYYQGRVFPPMPGQRGALQRPEDEDFGPPGFPFGMDEQNNFPPAMNGREDFPFPPGMAFPAAPPRMGGREDFPFGREMAPPPIPLTPGVKESFQQALTLSERNPSFVVLFVKPLDEFLPEKLTNRPDVASILQIDKYTGFGSDKPVNQLALFMSEQASPSQKTFALPILNEAPFFEEPINPGIPPGVRFNAFNAYLDLILSTAGDGEESLEPSPDDLVPDEIAPLVPVGRRSEMRNLKTPEFLSKLSERRAAIKELERIGEPAVGPLLDVLNGASVSSKLAAVQALGVIGKASATAPLNQVAQVPELKQAANLSISQIKAKNKAATERRPAAVHSFSIPQPSSIYSSFESSGSYTFVRALLKETSLAVDIDAETLIRKENGKAELMGWGFVEAIKVLERKLPDELSGKIRIRVINLNPQLTAKEIQRAFTITSELRGMIDIVDVPLRHHAFKGLGVFLEKDALKIASEKNRDLWKDELDILVKKPGANEVIDGRKLFLMALLHRAISGRLTERLRIAAVRLLQDLGVAPRGSRVYFAPENRSVLGIEFLEQIDRANKLLSSMA